MTVAPESPATAAPGSQRGLFAELRTSRYAALSILMLVVAGICIAAGTWQISRYDGKHVANDDLRRNARAGVDPVAGVVPLLGTAPVPTEDDVEFRTVSATGVYDVTDQLLVRKQQVNSVNGYLVLTPLRTDQGADLLVVRGFVADATATLRPGDVPAPPGGTVTVQGRVQPTQDADDKYVALDNGQVEVVNVVSAQTRLGGDVFGAYIDLDAGQAGTGGLTAIPAPDLSNPAGGAFELQHLAYIVQWYLFAGLALAAPVVMVRTDRKRAREDAAEAAARAEELARTAPPRKPGTALMLRTNRDRPVMTREQKLADRYGR